MTLASTTTTTTTTTTTNANTNTAAAATTAAAAASVAIAAATPKSFPALQELQLSINQLSLELDTGFKFLIMMTACIHFCVGGRWGILTPALSWMAVLPIAKGCHIFSTDPK
jgi:hypothetical protein